MKRRYYLTCIVIEDILEKTREAEENDDEIQKSAIETEENVDEIQKSVIETEENDDEMRKSVIETFYNMFTDDETDLKKLLEKYTLQTQQSKFNWIMNVFKDSDITKAKRKVDEKSDEEFIQELVKFELFEGHDVIKKEIINTFIDEYHKWKIDKFPNILQEILKNFQHNKHLVEDKLKREYEEEKKKIEKAMFEKLCNEIETKYKDG
jgi:hypothetical protein